MQETRAPPQYHMQRWAFVIPAVCLALMLVAFIVPMGTALAIACAVALMGAVIAAVLFFALVP